MLLPQHQDPTAYPSKGCVDAVARHEHSEHLVMNTLNTVYLSLARLGLTPNTEEGGKRSPAQRHSGGVGAAAPTVQAYVCV